MVTFYHDIEQDSDRAAVPDATSEQCRQIVKEFLHIENKLGVPVTYNVVGKFFQQQPELIEWITHSDQEIAFHSYNHQQDWKPEYFADEVVSCRNVSSLPCGYRSPRSQWNQTTLETLWKYGFTWNAESIRETLLRHDPHKEPYFIYEGLVRLPISADDWPIYTGRITAKEWVGQFSDLLRARSYVAIGTHDCVASLDPEVRLGAWEELLQVALKNDTLRVTFGEAAEIFRRSARATSLASPNN
jgi:hypothetical protein